MAVGSARDKQIVLLSPGKQKRLEFFGVTQVVGFKALDAGIQEFMPQYLI